MSKDRDSMKSDVDDAKRVLNTGESVKLKKLGEVTVRELSLEKIVTCASEVATLIASASFSQVTNPSDMLKLILSDPGTLQAVRVFAAASCDRKPEDFVDMGVSDWLTLIVAVKTVTDWEELKGLFMELGILDLLARRRAEAVS